MIIRIMRAAVVAIAISTLPACNSGSDSSPNNITAVAIVVNTPAPRIAYPLTTTVSLSADQPAENVTVSLFAIDETSDPNAEVRQIPLGTEVIEDLPAGSSDHELNVNVPSSVEISGPYHIAVVVDPVEEIAEGDEEDNTASVQVTLAPTIDPNVLLSGVELDRTALIINTDEYADQVDGSPGNVHNADAGGTITVGSDGLEVGETVDIEGFASLRITRTDNNTTLDVPLYLWNSDEQRYMNAYGIDPDTSVQGAVEWLPLGTFTPQLAEIIGEEAELDDIERNSEHMDFYFPGKLGFELEQALRYPPIPCTGTCTNTATPPTIPPPDLTAAAIDQLRSFLSGLPFSGVRGDESTSLAALDFAVCVRIRPADLSVTDSDASDNEACPSLEIFLPPLPPGTPLYNTGSYVPLHDTPSEPLTSGDGFATKNNNPHFAFNLDFGAGATADNRGYIETITAGIPVTLLGQDFDFYRVTARAQLVPDYLNKPSSDQSGFSYEIRFLNQVIEAIPPITASISGSLISYSKEIEKEQQFFVGPVPMIAGASVGGSIGLELTVGYADDDAPVFGGGNAVVSLGSSIGPFANLEAAMFAGVGTVVFAVGVEGVLVLLDERLVYFIGTEIEVIDDGFTSGDVEFMITQLQKLSNIFTGPQGKINLFAKYSVPAIRTCKWGFVKVPCLKLVTIKATKNIYSTPALFRREDVLFEDPFAQLDVVIVSGQSPAYFVP
ncbi:MAG: hypothetical protein IPK65_08250 [Gammaproteobacteria bacterium]|nr:hypothetical protein [Gammaproteobacteria bacterium]